jgi:SWI/SNF-related matrix-associated actin-dependent regulator 1 of chromatin subfamily A
LTTYTEHKTYKGRLIFTGAKNLYGLHESLKPFMLRRLKKDVLKDLPAKTNTPLFVSITNSAEYKQAENHFLSWLREKSGDEAAMNASRAEIITRMNALRQLAASGKVAPVCDWLKPCTDGQGKVIVFSSFLEPLESLKKCKPESVIYTGADSSQDRQVMVDKFQHTSDVCYFLGTVGAAGVGITLTAASRVAFLDLPWTPGGKVQAEDRAHRIGQTKPVEIVNVLARGTIDERMLQLLSDKEFIIAQAIDGKTKDEAISGSVANNLIESFIRAI